MSFKLNPDFESSKITIFYPHRRFLQFFQKTLETLDPVIAGRPHLKICKIAGMVHGYGIAACGGQCISLKINILRTAKRARLSRPLCCLNAINY